MPIEEQAEERIQGVVQRIITGGAKLSGRLVMRVGKKTALAAGGAGIRFVGNRIHNITSEGAVSEKKLQKLENGDLHMLELDTKTLRSVRKSLDKAGVRYHIERNHGQYFLHFAGKDVEHVRHAVQRAFRKAGIRLKEEDLTVDPEPRTRPTKPAPAPPAEPPTNPFSAYGATDPYGTGQQPAPAWTTPSQPADTQLEPAWQEPDTQPIPQAVTPQADQPESSGTPANPYGLDEDQLKAATDPYGANQQPAWATPSQPSSTQPDAFTPTPSQGGAGGARRKPIRSKKDLLDRFKSRLTENLNEQKTRKTPMPNRQRTQRKGR